MATEEETSAWIWWTSLPNDVITYLMQKYNMNPEQYVTEIEIVWEHEVNFNFKSSKLSFNDRERKHGV